MLNDDENHGTHERSVVVQLVKGAAFRYISTSTTFSNRFVMKMFLVTHMKYCQSTIMDVHIMNCIIQHIIAYSI